MTVVPPTWQPHANRSGSRMAPLSENVQGYSQEDVEHRMRSGAAIFKPRFELYDRHRNRIQPDIQGVDEAEVEWDETREIKRSLHIKMLPDERLRYKPYQYVIRPYFGIGPMRDGGTAEFSMGMFPWTRPKRDVLGTTGDTETWEATLGDLSHLLQIDGPVEEPYETIQGQYLVSHIQWVLYLAGFDTYGDEGVGIEWSDLTAASSAWFQYMTAAKQLPFWTMEWTSEEPQSWLEILDYLHSSVGYTRPYFDRNGFYRAQRDRAWDVEGADVVYDTNDDSVVLLPVSEEPDVEKLANRTVAFRSFQDPEGTGGWFTSWADLNWYFPTHPLCQAQTGIYITKQAKPATLPFVSSDAQMYDVAVRDLFERLAYFEIVTLRRVGFLGQHDAYHTVAVNVRNDPLLSPRWDQPPFSFWPGTVADLPLYRETGHKTDLFTGNAESKLAKLFRVVT